MLQLHQSSPVEIARGWVRDFLVGDAAGVPFCGEMTPLYGERYTAELRHWLRQHGVEIRAGHPSLTQHHACDAAGVGDVLQRVGIEQ